MSVCRFSITIFNTKTITDLPDWASFFMGQREKCPTTGRKHLQCYFETPSRRGLKKLIPEIEAFLGHHDFHVETSQGSQAQNITYCSKPETRYKNQHFTMGEPKNPGKRSDLTTLANIVTEGATDEDILNLNPSYFRYDRLIDKIRQVKMASFKTKLREVEVIFITGESGAGKSQQVWEAIQGKEYYIPPPPKNKTLWFNGYTGQDILVLDDLNSDDLARVLLLRLTDRYPLTLETKGNVVHACWTKIYITTNSVLEDWDEALHRRITTYINLHDFS